MVADFRWISKVQMNVDGQHGQHTHHIRWNRLGLRFLQMEETVTPGAEIGTHRIRPLNHDFLAVRTTVSLRDSEHGCTTPVEALSGCDEPCSPRANNGRVLAVEKTLLAITSIAHLGSLRRAGDVRRAGRCLRRKAQDEARDNSFGGIDDRSGV
jgi:hypothetical protein